MELRREHFTLALNEIDTLWVERFYPAEGGIPVLMVHGSIENGKVFYSSSGKGLAPFLAAAGYDVYVPDLRGKGKSTPRINRRSAFGQYEAITEDIPRLLERIHDLSGGQPIHLMAHSWGGVLLLAWYARFQGTYPVRSMVFFGSKRKIYIRSLKKFLMVDIGWNLLGRASSSLLGYLPAVGLRFGSDNESKKFYRETNHWVYSNAWKDKRDKLDYHKQLQSLVLPPILSLTGVEDDVLGHPNDVQQLLRESGAADFRYVTVGKKYGFRHDYGHIDLLTHPDAPEDHFRLVLDWLKQH